MEMTGSDWVLSTKRVPVRGVADLLPRAPGLYAVFINDPRYLPDPFGEIAATRANPHLLYVGQASGSLYQRVWVEELQHRNPGTLFRSIGVMLGYISPQGGKNFVFAPRDKCAISGWITEHLAVAWTVAVRHMNAEERGVILCHCPLLNIMHNPKKLRNLKSYAQSRSEASEVRVRCLVPVSNGFHLA